MESATAIRRMELKTLAMVLAGGRVDDLSALTYYRPKSALPFGGFARVIDFALTNLMQSGVQRVGVLSQFRNYLLIDHVGSGAAWDMVGRYRGISLLPPFQGPEGSSWYRGSADALHQHLGFVRHHDPENVLILSGDHVYHLDYREILEYHRERHADLTVAFVRVPRASAARRFGVARLDDEDGERGGRVIAYEEKPADPRGNWASMTIYCFRPQTLYQALAANAAEETSHEFGHDIIPRLLTEGRRVYGFKFNGYWGYTRTIDEYWRTSMDLLGQEPKVPLKEWGLRTNLEHRGIRDCPPVKIGEGARIKNSLIYNGAIIEGEVENSIVFPRVQVAKGTSVRNSILFFNCRLAEGGRFNRVITDVDSRFGNGCQVGGEGEAAITVVGSNNTLARGTVVESGAILYPRLDPDLIPRRVAADTVVRSGPAGRELESEQR